MASHHHHHHHHHYQNNHHHPPTTTTTTTCCCAASPHLHLQPSHSQPATDPLLQAIALQHLLQSPQTHLYSQSLKPQQHQQKQQQQQQQYQQQQQTQFLFSSLLHRIDALESSLHRLSASQSLPSYSLRDIAARTIQTHFRAFLVRRSCTLRHLKDLAFIKSSLNSLKCSLSDKTNLNFEVLSQKAMDLLLKLDSIQNRDSMIRDGKKSISRELVQFLEFVEGVSRKRLELSSKAMNRLRFAESCEKSRGFGSIYDPFLSREVGEHGLGINGGDPNGNQRAFRDRLRDEGVQGFQSFSRVSENDEEEEVELEGFHHISDDGEKFAVLNNGMTGLRSHEISAKPKKRVSFAQNGNLTRVFKDTREQFPIGDDDGGVLGYDQSEDLDNLCQKVEEIGSFSRVSKDDDEEIQMENEGSLQVSDSERNPRKNGKPEVHYIGGKYQYQDENSAFTPPSPILMEPRTDSNPKVKTKKTLRIVR